VKRTEPGLSSYWLARSGGVARVYECDSTSRRCACWQLALLAFRGLCGRSSGNLLLECCRAESSECAAALSGQPSCRIGKLVSAPYCVPGRKIWPFACKWLNQSGNEPRRSPRLPIERVRVKINH
jgi:hypothetical protein